MNFQTASKHQLLTIAFDETNSLEDRYEAAAELQKRQHEE